MLHTTYETPKREFSCYIQRMKHQKREFSHYIQRMLHQKENFHATYNVCNTKKRIFTLHTTYEAPKKRFYQAIISCKKAKITKSE